MFGLPVGVVAFILVLIVASASIGVLYLFRNSVKFEIREGHNEIAGFVFATVGVLYAVVLAFVVFAVWERFSANEQAVTREAALIVAAYRDTQDFPQPQRAQAQREFRMYIDEVLAEEASGAAHVLSTSGTTTHNPTPAATHTTSETPADTTPADTMNDTTPAEAQTATETSTEAMPTDTMADTTPATTHSTTEVPAQTTGGTMPTDTGMTSHTTGGATAHGEEDALNPIWRIYRAAGLRPDADRTLLASARDRLHEVELARHERHLSQESSLPGIFWAILLLGAVCTLVFTFLFDMGNVRVQGMLTALLAGLMTALLFLVLSLDRPFTGLVKVSKAPYEHTLHQFAGIDAIADLVPVPPKSEAVFGDLIPTSLARGSCTVQSAPLQPDAVQSAICTPPPTGCLGGKPCPDSWEVSTFRTTAALERAYAALREADGVGSNHGRCNGTTWGGEGSWAHGPAKPGGRRFCNFKGNDAVVVWTHEKLGQASHVDMLGVASLGGSDHARLYNWWNFWHHLIGKCQQAGCIAKLP